MRLSAEGTNSACCDAGDKYEHLHLSETQQQVHTLINTDKQRMHTLKSPGALA
jgi:hypothetical protein